MTEETPTTIPEAIEQIALGMVASGSENGRQFTNLSIDELTKAEGQRAGAVAAGKPHFGLRFTKCIPPGGG
jgi:hypothetical protein